MFPNTKHLWIFDGRTSLYRFERRFKCNLYSNSDVSDFQKKSPFPFETFSPPISARSQCFVDSFWDIFFRYPLHGSQPLQHHEFLRSPRHSMVSPAAWRVMGFTNSTPQMIPNGHHRQFTFFMSTVYRIYWNSKPCIKLYKYTYIYIYKLESKLKSILKGFDN